MRKGDGKRERERKKNKEMEREREMEREGGWKVAKVKIGFADSRLDSLVSCSPLREENFSTLCLWRGPFSCLVPERDLCYNFMILE